MDSELMIKLLSMGVVASFVTGIFSLIISIKNNKKLLQIEDKKERFQMDGKRYELLIEFLKDVEGIKFVFEKEEGNPEQNWNYLRKTFVDSINIFERIEKLHNEKSYLIDDPSTLTSEIEEIDQSISNYVQTFKDDKEIDQDKYVIEMDKICISIYNLRNDYLSVLRKNMERILKRI